MTDDTHTLIPLPAWFVLIVTLLFGCPSNAYSAPVFKAEGVNGKPASLRLFETPCTSPKVVNQLNSMVKPQLIAMFKRASLLWDGKTWESCWLDLDGVVFSIDEEGSQFQPVPRVLFREDTI